MAKLVSVSIDVTKLDKTRFYQGAKGTYATLMVMLNDEPDQYGKDAQVWEGQTKEEREAKENRNFLGNGKVIWQSEGQQPAQQQTPPPADDESDTPF